MTALVTFTVDLSYRDFRALILYDFFFFFGSKSYGESCASLTICLGVGVGESPAKSAVTKWYRKFQFG